MYPLVPLGDALTLDIDEVCVDPYCTYDIAGIYSFGRSIFARGPVTGTETSYKFLNRLHAGRLVLSRLKAFEGAVAVVPDEFDGWFLSPEFPTFSCVSEAADPTYMSYMCRWPAFWELLAAASKGVGARREPVHAEDLLAIEVPLPDIEEQRALVSWLDRILQRQEVALTALEAHSADTFVRALPALVEAEFRNAAESVTNLAHLVELVGDVVHPGDDASPAKEFVGLQHVESHTGRRLGAEPVGNEKGRKFRFEPGDIVYGYLRPYLNKAWVADRNGLCSVDQYVLRATGRLRAGLLGHVLRSLGTLEQARELTHSLQLPRLRSGLLMAITVPDVPRERQVHLEARLDALVERVMVLAAARRRQEEMLNALGKAALNRAFTGVM